MQSVLLATPFASWDYRDAQALGGNYVPPVQSVFAGATTTVSATGFGYVADRVDTDQRCGPGQTEGTPVSPGFLKGGCQAANLPGYYERVAAAFLALPKMSGHNSAASKSMQSGVQVLGHVVLNSSHVKLTFDPPFATAPRLLLSTRSGGSADSGGVLVATALSVSTTSALVRASALAGAAKSSSDASSKTSGADDSRDGDGGAMLDWLAWSTAADGELPTPTPHRIGGELSIDVSQSPKAVKRDAGGKSLSLVVPLPPALFSFGHPLVLASAGWRAKNAHEGGAAPPSMAASVGVKNSTHFTLHLGCVGTKAESSCSLPASKTAAAMLHVSWLAFERTTREVSASTTTTTTSTFTNINNDNDGNKNTADSGVRVGLSVVRGPFVTEVRQTWDSGRFWQTFRLFTAPPLDKDGGSGGGGGEDSAASTAELDAVEIIATVGPLERGRELVSRFETDLATADATATAGGAAGTTGILYSDDNGLDTVRRRWDTRKDEPIAGNYWPAVSRAFIRDNNAQGVTAMKLGGPRQLTLVGDRSHGVGAFKGGMLELMLHRRCAQDDGYGVNEILDDDSRISPKLWLLAGGAERSTRAHKRLAVTTLHPPALLFGAAPAAVAAWAATHLLERGFMAAPLPEQVHLLTLRCHESLVVGPDAGEAEAAGSGVLLRLQHVYEVSDGAAFQQPATVLLPPLLQGLRLAQPTPLSLSAAASLSELQQRNGAMRWRTIEDEEEEAEQDDEKKSAEVKLEAAGAAAGRAGPAGATLRPRDLLTWSARATRLKSTDSHAVALMLDEEPQHQHWTL